MLSNFKSDRIIIKIFNIIFVFAAGEFIKVYLINQYFFKCIIQLINEVWVGYQFFVTNFHTPNTNAS